MKKLLIIIAGFLVFGSVASAQTITQLQQWLFSGNTLYPRISSSSLKIPSLGSASTYCLTPSATGVIATTTCGDGSGSSGSVSTSSPITQFNFPYWATVGGGLNGTSTLVYDPATGLIALRGDNIVTSTIATTPLSGFGTISSPLIFTNPGFASSSILISSAGLLTGGGDLTANRTLTLASTTIWSLFSNTAAGLTYNNGTGGTSLTANYFIPLVASGTQWNSAFASSSLFITTSTNLGVTNFQSPNISQWTNNSNYITVASVPATTTINSTQAAVFRLIANSGVTSTLDGATTTFSLVNTGNWAGTWQGVNSTTFYLASNPSGYISSAPATTTISAQGTTYTGPAFTFATSGPMLAITGSGAQINFTITTSSLNLGTAAGFSSNNWLASSTIYSTISTSSAGVANQLAYWTSASAIAPTSTIFLTTSTNLGVANFATSSISQWNTGVVAIANGGTATTTTPTTNAIMYFNGVSISGTSTVMNQPSTTIAAYATGTVAAKWTTFQQFDTAGASTTQLWSRSSTLTNFTFGNATGTNIDLTGLLKINGDKVSTSTGGGSVSTSSAITQYHFPFWASVTGQLSGTSTLSITGTTFNSSGTITVNGDKVSTSTTGGSGANSTSTYGLLSWTIANETSSQRNSNVWNFGVTSTIGQVRASNDASGTVTFNLGFATNTTVATSTWRKLFTSDQTVKSTTSTILTPNGSTTAYAGDMLGYYTVAASSTAFTFSVDIVENLGFNVLTDADGVCWKLSVATSTGVLSTQSVTCP